MCCDEEFNSPGDVLESKLRHIAQTGLEAREKILARKASKVAKSDGDPSRTAESAAADKEALLDMLDDEEQEASKKQKKAKKKAKKKGAAPRRRPSSSAAPAPPPRAAPARPAPPPRDDDVPEEFLCPITFEIMTDPVIAADGRMTPRDRRFCAHVAGDERP
ncbi:hypothetical protein JL721_10933 [Aureococcus anophagefferens]|nr:hypothetical protein JL721_10933 [Aureococcus anophagefferens]